MRKLDEQLAALATMSPAQLLGDWERVYERPAPLLSPALLRMGIAYRLQEKKHGSLPAVMRRHLKSIAAGGSVAAKPPTPALRPGAQLIREWQGRTVSVLVEEEGFRFEGKRYASLNSIAKAVTGAHWSGPRFFGIKARD